MGDVRYLPYYQRVRDADDPIAEIRSLTDEEVISALAAASTQKDPYLANVLATEAMNRVRRSWAILTNLGEGVFGLDSLGRVTYANPAAGSLLGVPEGGYLGKNLHDLVHGEENGCRLRDALLAGAFFTADDERFHRVDGPPLDVAVAVGPIVREGEIVGAVLAFRDITERRRAEAERDEFLRREQAARAEAEEAHWRLAFLADASEMLSASLDYETTLARVADLAVPRLADWCAVDVADENGGIRRLALAYARPQDAADAEALRTRFTPAPGGAMGVPRVIATGEPELYAEVPDALLEAHARSADHLEVLRRVRPSSMAIVPLLSRGRVVGAINFVISHSGRRYHESDLALFEDLARRAGSAVDNAQLYTAERDARADLEEAIAERDRTLEGLRRAEERYRLLVELSPEPMAVHAGGLLLYVNQAAVRLMGAQHAEDLVGRPVLDLVHPDDRDLVARRMRAVAQDRRPLPPALERLVRLDGGVVRCEVAAIPIEFEGKPAVQLALRDMTVRLASEDALRASETRLRLLVESVEDYAIFTLDTSGRITSWNPGAARLKGYEAHEVIGRPLSLFYPEEDAKSGRAARLLEKARLEGSAHDEGWRVRKDGSRFWANVLLTAIRDDAGHLLGYGKVTRDVTAQRALGEAAKARERQQGAAAQLGLEALRSPSLDRLFDDAVRLLASILDVEYAKVLELETRGEALLLRAGVGWKDGLVGRATVGAGKDSQAGFTLLSDQPVVVHDLATETRFDGPPLLVDHGVRSGMSVVIQGRERPWGVLGVHTTRVRSFSDDDVNFLQTVANVLAGAVEQRQAQAEARRLAEILELRVRERTSQLEAANRELEAFSYSVSHDLRAPLRGLDAYSQALVEDYGDRLDEDGRRLLARLRDESRRLTDLVHDLLQLSRATQGEMRRERVDVTEIARAVGEEIARRESGRTLAIRVEEGVEANADPRLVRVILENLIGNAAKFTRGVEPATIEVGWLQADQVPTYFVRDNGVGFDMAEAGRLFLPFSRLSSGAAHEGTGVGLATVRRIVERHGGRIWAESEPGKGASFSFTLGR